MKHFYKLTKEEFDALTSDVTNALAEIAKKHDISGFSGTSPCGYEYNIYRTAQEGLLQEWVGAQDAVGTT